MSQIPPPPPGLPPQNEAQQRAQQAADAARAAAQDAMGAFKTMMSDPIGSLGTAFRQLGDAKGLSVGAVFGIVGAIAMALGFVIYISAITGGFATPGFMDTVKVILAQLVGVAGCTAGFMLLAPVFKVSPNLSASVFSAGSAYLMIGISILAAGVFLKLGMGRLSFMAAGLAILTGSSFGVLAINAAWRQIFGATERSASLGVPGCLAIAAAVSYVVAWLIG